MNCLCCFSRKVHYTPQVIEVAKKKTVLIENFIQGEDVTIDILNLRTKVDILKDRIRLEKKEICRGFLD